jgi:hypothetical protein
MMAETGMKPHDDGGAPEYDDGRAPEYKNADRQARRQTNQQPDGPTVVPATRARQAVGGHNARYVLAFGLAAVIIVFAAIYLVYFT